MATRSLAARGWTIERLHALPDDGKRYEIIDGVLYVTPSPRLLHQRAVYRLALLLEAYASGVGLEVMPLPGDVRYSDGTLVQPDAFVFSRGDRPRASNWDDVHPLILVVEVLSPSTRRRDRTVKRDLYQSRGVREYWIVDIDARAIERWRPDASSPEVVVDALAWAPVAAASALVIDVIAYFRDLLPG